MEDSKCKQEVEGDGEGVLLLEWHEDLYFLATNNQTFVLVPNMLKGLKIGSTTRGITTRSGP